MHGRDEHPVQPSLLDEVARWARAGCRLSLQEKCVARRLVGPHLQLRAGVPEPAKVVGLDTTLGEARAKYLIRFDKDQHQELVEPEFVERVHVDVLQFFWSHRDRFPHWYEVVCVLA